MKDLPILFSGPMVKAIFDGRKTMTRRLVTPQPTPCGKGFWHWEKRHGMVWSLEQLTQAIAEGSRFQVGRRMWVRETCWIWGQWVRNGVTATGRQKWRFRAIGQRVVYERPAETAKRGGEGWGFRHARYMPRWASRLTLAITAHRVERLHEITEDDARAEGVFVMPRPPRSGGPSFVSSFAALWDEINGERAPWSSNPWVEVVSFERVP